MAFTYFTIQYMFLYQFTEFQLYKKLAGFRTVIYVTVYYRRP